MKNKHIHTHHFVNKVSHPTNFSLYSSWRYNIAMPFLQLVRQMLFPLFFFLGIYRYVDTFSLVGGVNAPKKIGCVGTDGIERPQLIKVEHLFNITHTRKNVYTRAR
jgi:hypothetical protein